MLDVKLTDLIYHVPNFLSKLDCDMLIQEFEDRKNEGILENCPHAITGVDTTSSYERIILNQGSKSYNLIHSSTEAIIKDYINYLNQFDCFHIGLQRGFSYSHMYRLLKYPTGAKIHPHVDHDIFIYGSCTFNLNDDYDGGEFCFFRGKHKIKLGRGDALIFPADYFWVHEVQEVTDGVRYSTNSFLQQVPQNIRNDVQSYTSVLMNRDNIESPYNFED